MITIKMCELALIMKGCSVSISASDLFNGEEPEEYGGGKQTDWGKKQGFVPGAVWPESGPDPQPGQHPPAHHGKYVMLCFVLKEKFPSFNFIHFSFNTFPQPSSGEQKYLNLFGTQLFPCLSAGWFIIN